MVPISTGWLTASVTSEWPLLLFFSSYHTKAIITNKPDDRNAELDTRFMNLCHDAV